VHAVEIPEREVFSPPVLFQATVNGREQVVMGTIDGAVVAVAKLAFEEGVLVLRGVQVAEPWQRKGLGARLLAVVASRLTEPCYVIPYAHLERFYARAGFVRLEAGIPQFLVDRCEKYRSKGDNVFVARR
jgi:N-acetylglutamate synthase-like GNAT family acetyltransferase